ncbi:hypothetical protein FOPG_19603 [Fusarium oxysporum f. sp. conglutinans race 2 54008]|uniref:Uncharacterized protein n=1 Tax=Fusarium oxysporum f. sp. conglutinans race 2 54008 TaxID=1089457 RepID=X0GKF0_FUSOX|nr:hypothetical protein FOPG_19603 [Fusarium oxysporum f. sp. conglutinans race 2 54008]
MQTVVMLGQPSSTSGSFSSTCSTSKSGASGFSSFAARLKAMQCRFSRPSSSLVVWGSIVLLLSLSTSRRCLRLQLPCMPLAILEIDSGSEVL